MKQNLLACFLLTFFVTIFLNGKSQADEAYFREGFEEGTNWPTVVYTTPQAIVGNSGMTFYASGVYRTTGGTGACAAQTGGLWHARFANQNLTAADSSYLITPLVSRGIYRIKFLNGRAARRFTIYKTTDISETTTNWTFVVHFPTTNAACDQVDYIVNDATARRLKIVSRSATDSDIDSLVMTNVSTFPVRFAGFKITSQTEGVKLSWDVATEQDIVGYNIERSPNGKDFEKIGAQTSFGNSVTSVSYNWIDRFPAGGVSYYRIKAIDKDGGVMYTNVLKNNSSNTKAEISVAPNPVKGGELNVQLTSLTKGTYSLKLYNNVGQLVYTGQLSTEGGSLNETFRLPATVKSGIYNLQVTGGDVKLNKRVVVE